MDDSIAPLLNDVANQAVASLTNVAVKGTVLLLFAIVVAVLLRRQAAAVKHLVWMCTLVLLLGLPLLGAMLPEWGVLPNWTTFSESHGREIATPDSDVASNSSLVSPGTSPRESGSGGKIAPNALEETRVAASPFSETDRGRVAAAAPVGDRSITMGHEQRMSQSTRRDTQTKLAAESVLGLPEVILFVWLAGVVMAGMRLLWGAFSLWRLSRLSEYVTGGTLIKELEKLRYEFGLRRPIRLLVGHWQVMPMVWGVHRTCVLVPRGIEDWPQPKRRAVLLHELGHVVRRDVFWQLLGELTRALYWFHPLVWVAVWRLQIERERACDDLVLRRGVTPQDYARQLLDLVTGGQVRSARYALGVAMASKARIERRLRTIMDVSRNRLPVARRHVLCGIAVCLLIGVPLAMVCGADGPDRRADNGQTVAEEDSSSANGDSQNAQAAEPETLPFAKPTQQPSGKVFDQPGWYRAEVRSCSATLGVTDDGKLLFFVKGPTGAFYLHPSQPWTHPLPWVAAPIQRSSPGVLSALIQEVDADATWFACWDEKSRLWWYHEDMGVMRMTLLGGIVALEKYPGLLSEDWHLAPTEFVKRLPDDLPTEPGEPDHAADELQPGPDLEPLQGTWQRMAPGERAIREKMVIEGDRETFTRTWLDGSQRLFMVSRIERTVQGDVPIYNRAVLEFLQRGRRFNEVPQRQAFVYKLWDGLLYEIPGLLHGPKSIRTTAGVIPWQKAAN